MRPASGVCSGHTADVGGAEPGPGGQLVEHAIGEEAVSTPSSAVANSWAIPAILVRPRA